MEEIKVSVIIPVYNTQDFVREAIESITRQSLRETEIIVVDDGSTDDSPSILRGLAAADPRICIFTQPNRGQSDARNLGLDNARGEYVYFMDSDDLLRPDALATCYEKCRAQQLDFVAFDADIFGDGDGVFSPDFYHRTAGMDDRTYRGIELMNLMMDQHRFRVPVWLSVIRRAFIEDHGLRFIPGSTHEDELFTALCYIQAERAGVIPQAFFRRRVRGSSTMTTRFAWRNMDSYFRVTDELIRFAGIHGRDTAAHSTDRTGNDGPTPTGKGAGRNDNDRDENDNAKRGMHDNADTGRSRMINDIHNGPPSGREVRDTVDRFLFRMLNPAVCRAAGMPFTDRLKIARLCLTEYFDYIKPRTLAVLLLKRPHYKITGRK